MMHLLDQLPIGFGRPTRAEVERALEEMPKIPGFYVSNDPGVRLLQARCYAHIYAGQRVREENAAKGVKPDYVPPPPPPSWLEDERKTIALMGYSSVYAKAVWSDPDRCWQTDIVTWLKYEYDPSGKPNALILGGTGSGKTWGAVAYVSHKASIYQEYLNAEFITAYKIGEYLSRRNYSALDRLEQVRLLLVDDLGAEASAFRGDDFVAHFSNLFATRHAHGRKTIITSNGDIESIKAIYGDRFISRFRESGMVYISDGDDMRAAQ